MLKNAKSEISKALSSMATMRRIALSGTPIQNNLSEYFRMASWIKPGCLGTESEYERKYCSSIMESLNVSFCGTFISLSNIGYFSPQQVMICFILNYRQMLLKQLLRKVKS